MRGLGRHKEDSQEILQSVKVGKENNSFSFISYQNLAFLSTMNAGNKPKIGVPVSLKNSKYSII